MLPLSSSERRKLRAQAHALEPVAMVGAQGPTAAVIAEIERALAAHELIKIRAFSDLRGERETWLNTLCESLAAAPVQHIGKILVIYRPHPPEREHGGAGTVTKRRRGARKTKKQMLSSR